MIFVALLVGGVILFTLYTNAVAKPDPMNDPEITRILAEPLEEPRLRRVIWPIGGDDDGETSDGQS